MFNRLGDQLGIPGNSDVRHWAAVSLAQRLFAAAAYASLTAATAIKHGAITAWTAFGLILALRYLAHKVIEPASVNAAFATALLTDLVVVSVVLGLDIGPVPPALFVCVYLLRWYRVYLARTYTRNTPMA